MPPDLLITGGKAMHYDVSYKDKSDRQAVLDLVHWVRFKAAHELIKCVKKGMTFDQFRFWCSFAGVKGKPVNAAWEKWRKK